MDTGEIGLFPESYVEVEVRNACWLVAGTGS